VEQVHSTREDGTMFGRRGRAHERYIDEYPFSGALHDRFAQEHPELSAQNRELVFAGLRQWFLVCRLAGPTFVAMPSVAVDDAWHEFILFTREYARFCQAAFGHFLHHTPTAGLEVGNPGDVMRDGYILSWHHACAVDEVDPLAPDRLPLLFALDERLEIASRFAHSLETIATERGTARHLLERLPLNVAVAPTATAAWWPVAHGNEAVGAGPWWSRPRRHPLTWGSVVAGRSAVGVAQAAVAVVDHGMVSRTFNRIGCAHV
jgi:hypothetical protein